jgi:hypothetical protein
MFENQLASGFRLLVGPICVIALSTLEAQSDGGKDVLVELPANEQASNPSDWLSPLPAKDSRIPLPKTGALYERWDGVAGNTIADLRNSQAFLEEQSHIGIIQGLSTPPGDGKDYGVRIRAWIVAPKNGKVRFVTSSDDNSELWLSPNADPFQRREIAWISGEGWFGWTAPGQTNRINSQWSAPQPMVAGNSYYLEVWHKERNSDDHLSVLWQWEDDEKPLPVPPEVLRPSQLHPADADDNGLPDAWEAKTGLARLGNVHAWQDSDGDGVLNIHEY